MCIRSQETEHFNVVFPQPFETGLMTVNSSYDSRSKPTQFAHLPLSSHCSSCELLTSPSGAVCFRQTLTVSLPELPASTTSSMERNETIYPQTTLKRGYRYYPLSLWKDMLKIEVTNNALTEGMHDSSLSEQLPFSIFNIMT